RRTPSGQIAGGQDRRGEQRAGGYERPGTRMIDALKHAPKESRAPHRQERSRRDAPEREPPAGAQQQADDPGVRGAEGDANAEFEQATSRGVGGHAVDTDDSEKDRRDRHNRQQGSVSWFSDSSLRIKSPIAMNLDAACSGSTCAIARRISWAI